MNKAIAFLALIALAFAVETEINFNFAGMIPEGSGDDSDNEEPCPVCETCEPVPTEVVVMEGSDNAGVVAGYFVDDLFEADEYLVNYKVRSGPNAGSTLGLRNFFQGFSDIALSSRLLRTSDYSNVGCNSSYVVSGMATAPCQGVMPVPVVIATDFVVFYVHASNPVTDITSAQAQQLLDGATWLSVFGKGPDAPADFYVPPTDSTTSDVTEFATGLDFSDGIIINGSPMDIYNLVRTDPNAISFVGVNYLINDFGNDVKALSYNGVSYTDFENYDVNRPLYAWYNSMDTTHQGAMARDFLCEMLHSSAAEDKQLFPNSDEVQALYDEYLDC